MFSIHIKLRTPLDKVNSQINRTILVAVDGSLHSLKALNYAIQMFDTLTGTKILVLNVIEWANNIEDSIDRACHENGGERQKDVKWHSNER